MERAFLGAGVVGVCGEDGGEVTDVGQHKQLVAIGVAGEGPGTAVGVEADVEIGGVEVVEPGGGKFGAVAGNGRIATGRRRCRRGGECNRYCRSIIVQSSGTGRSRQPVDSVVVQPAVVAAPLPVDGRPVTAGVGLSRGSVPEVLEFNEEMPGTEDLSQIFEDDLGGGGAPRIDECTHLAVSATRETDDALAVFVEGIAGDDRRTVALGYGQVCRRDEAAQIGVALARLGEEHQVVGGSGGGLGAFFACTGAFGRRQK
jgi:hypothetical protein